jgi:Trypsin
MKKKILFAMSLATAALSLTAVPASAITNGELDTTHDFVGAMTGADPGGTQRLCSGSLIDEGVFLTAGHCAVLTDVQVKFGDDISNPDAVFAATSVVRHPQFAGNFGKQFDVGLVLFDQGDVVLPVAPIAGANYIDSFTKPQLKTFTFETFGYGLSRTDTTGNSLPPASDPLRRAATQTYLNQHNQYLGLSIHTNKGNGGGCSGDSGGPHLLNGVIVSVTSNGDGNCVATDNTQRIDLPVIRDWILSYVD